MLKIFNTLTKKKEVFSSIDKKKVNIYVCGITVYDYCHIGHARTFSVFDMIVRYLKYCNYKVNYVRNITDIDDKIIQKALLNNEDINNFTNKMIQCMNDDFLNLGLLSPTYQPRVTNYINQIISFIKKLIDTDHAYISHNGDIIFSVKSCEKYGILSNQKLNKLKLGNKNIHNIKQSNYDFVLWKKIDQLDHISWSSPWGLGRPGWHIECSTINNVFFGKNLDIHGGGSDLLFPHHENERAQSLSFYNEDSYGNYWIHVGSLLVNNSKMSKSLNNTIFLKDLLLQYNSEVIRYFFFMTHYRKPIMYRPDDLYRSYSSLKKFYILLYKMMDYKNNNSICSLKYNHFKLEFFNAINDDFNTPKAISILFNLLKTINILIRNNNLSLAIQLTFELKDLANTIGLLNQDPKYFFKKK